MANVCPSELLASYLVRGIYERGHSIGWIEEWFVSPYLSSRGSLLRFKVYCLALSWNELYVVGWVYLWLITTVEHICIRWYRYAESIFNLIRGVAILYKPGRPVGPHRFGGTLCQLHSSLISVGLSLLIEPINFRKRGYITIACGSLSIPKCLRRGSYSTTSPLLSLSLFHIQQITLKFT